MIACIFNPGSCIPEWAKLIWAYWDSLLLVLFIGMGIGALAGWKGLLIAVTGGLALLWRRSNIPPDASEHFPDGHPDNRKPVRRTAKRTPATKRKPPSDPPESLSGTF